jgi:hypothetical protein
LPLQLRPRPILPELLSAFDKHIQVLADQSPRDNMAHHTWQRWITFRRRSAEDDLFLGCMP